MNIRIKKHKLYSFIIILLVYQIALVSFPYFPQYKFIKAMCIIVLAILLLSKIKVVRARCVEAKIVIPILLYLLAVMVSAFINQGKYFITNPLYGAGIYCLSVFEIMCSLLYVAKRESPCMIIKTFFAITLSYVLMNDFFLWINPSMFSTNSTYYFIGNKFSVAYTHIQLIALYILHNYIKEKKYKNTLKYLAILTILCVLSVYVSDKVGSTSGIIGIFLLIVFINVPYLLKKGAINWFIMLICMCMLPFLYEGILANQYVEYFIVDVLKKSITLTGRTVIYNNITNLLSNHLLFGYGFGSTYEVWSNYIGMPNSQNGLIDCVLEQGLIATILLVVVLFIIMRRSCMKYNKNNLYNPVFAIIYVYTFLSSIEITINITYIFWFLFLYAIILYRDA